MTETTETKENSRITNVAIMDSYFGKDPLVPKIEIYAYEEKGVARRKFPHKIDRENCDIMSTTPPKYWMHAITGLLVYDLTKLYNHVTVSYLSNITIQISAPFDEVCMMIETFLDSD